MADIYNLTDTWNDAGTPFNGISIDVTNTASHADSRVQRWKVNGVEKASLTTDGMLNLSSGELRLKMPTSIGSYGLQVIDNGYTAGCLAITYNDVASVTFGSVHGDHNMVVNRGRQNGQIVWGTGIVEPLNLAGIGSPGAGIIAITNGSTGDGALELSYVRTKPLTVSGLPAAGTAGDGARAFVTNALTPVYGSTVVGGGAVKTPVYSDGTNWIVG